MAQGSSFSRNISLIPSSVMIGLFFVVPFVLILLTSFSVETPTGDYRLGFSLAHYQRFATWFYIERALFSAGLCALIAIISLLIAYPFTYLLTTFNPRVQTFWLIYILAQLSLSEVLIAFSWQILLSRTGGIANILVWVGLAENSFAMAPSAGAVLAALVYLAVPFSVLLLYPAISRLDRSLTEASRTLGASPLRSFFTVVLPATRPAIISSAVTVFVLTLGAIVVPQVLGKPQHWTLSVLITDQAIFNFNMPFAAALAVVLLIISASVIALVTRFGQGGKGGGNKT